MGKEITTSPLAFDKDLSKLSKEEFKKELEKYNNTEKRIKYNIIATNLDGTLLTSNKKITPKTKKFRHTKRKWLLYRRSNCQKPIKCTRSSKHQIVRLFNIK